MNFTLGSTVKHCGQALVVGYGGRLYAPPYRHRCLGSHPAHSENDEIPDRHVRVRA
ncbi:MAG: hypothetical protein H6976_14840 [Gammaproteobacteria bacterium]|nr:hypothetical protein [Gammaproteobacteria bacterium]